LANAVTAPTQIRAPQKEIAKKKAGKKTMLLSLAKISSNSANRQTTLHQLTGYTAK
jgi:hypothetical protein